MELLKDEEGGCMGQVLQDFLAQGKDPQGGGLARSSEWLGSGSLGWTKIWRRFLG